eukprot:JP447121.1.p2 GENE.JP447121.1~~JP447121.1.p2  ORF type:complete len:214 (+),score=95.71 JP447121.1:22-642(+)
MKNLCVVLLFVGVAAGTAQVQKPAPDFGGKDNAVFHGEFINLSLKDYIGSTVVLFFYPMDFTFVCPTEILAFSDRISEFDAINTKVIGVSTDSVHVHMAYTKASKENNGVGDINFPLLADNSHVISKEYGVLLENEGIAMRGLFIISETGVIRHASINDLPVGRSVDEVLRLVKAFQHTDKHGDLCPANWTPGSKTLSDPYAKKEL